MGYCVALARLYNEVRIRLSNCYLDSENIITDAW